MSVFYIEGKITLNSWDDIIHRPCFESPVDPQQYRYVRIAAVYSFKDQSARCGEVDCLQAHSQGFLVVTSDGKETNLCEACGLRFFDVSFEEQKKTLQRQARVGEQKTQLNSILERSSEIKSRVKELKQLPKGANWLYRSLASFKQTYPADLLSVLSALVADKDDEDILAALGKIETDPSQLEYVEQIQGLGIFVADIREELIGKILKPLVELEALTGDLDPMPSLARYCRWADSLEEQFARAKYLVEEGRAFFNAENLERLKSIPLPKDCVRLVQSLHWDCDKATAKKKAGRDTHQQGGS